MQKAMSGFHGSTMIKTPNGAVPIKKLTYGSLISTLYDDQYEFVVSVTCDRAEEAFRISIDGLPNDLILTPMSSLIAIDTPDLNKEMHQVPAAMIREEDLVVCPFRKYVDVPHSSLVPLLRYSKFMGAFCSAGRIDGDSIVFSMCSVNRNLLDEISRLTDNYVVTEEGDNRFIVINDDDLLKAVICVFGLSGMGAIPSSILNMDRQAKLVFIGGFIDASGYVDCNSNIICPLDNIQNGLQVLELLWNIGIKAAILKPKPPMFYSYSLILENGPFIEENTGKLKYTHNTRTMPLVRLGKDRVFLHPSKVEPFSLEDKAVYSIQTTWNSSYVAGMVAVNGHYETIKKECL
jgi:hypothetical protein